MNVTLWTFMSPETYPSGVGEWRTRTGAGMTAGDQAFVIGRDLDEMAKITLAGCGSRVLSAERFTGEPHLDAAIQVKAADGYHILFDAARPLPPDPLDGVDAADERRLVVAVDPAIDPLSLTLPIESLGRRAEYCVTLKRTVADRFGGHLGGSLVAGPATAWAALQGHLRLMTEMRLVHVCRDTFPFLLNLFAAYYPDRVRTVGPFNQTHK